MILYDLIPLVVSYLSTGIFQFLIIPVLSLAFVAVVPCIIRQLVRR